MKVKIDLPEIEGYEYTGEYRHPKKDEYLLGNDNTVRESSCSLGRFPILRPKRWRADTNCDYWCFGDDLNIQGEMDKRHPEDNDRYDIGNYFQTKEQCQQAIDKIKEVLK